MLHATVVDDKQHIVTNLDRTAFSVFEDGKQQNIISFHHVDIPVAMGIVIDNSGLDAGEAKQSEPGGAEPGPLQQSAG